MASPSSTRSRRSFWAAIVAALTFGSSLLVAGVSAPSVLAGDKGDAVGPVEVSSAVYSDVSAPVRDLVGVAPAPSTDKEKKEKPLRVLPNKGNALNQADGALQTTSGPLVGTTNGLNFAGVGAGDYGWISDQWAPPDTNGAVGQTQYVQWVNTSFAVFDKATGAIVSGFPKPGNSIWAGFAGGGGGCQTNNDGDPIVQYDKLANRWILTQFSVSTTPYLQCVAVSTTSDATGTYNRYAFTEPYFNDYPKLGVWPDGYYLTFNMFNGNSFAGARACALDRAKMLTGDPAATQQCFQLSTSYGGLLPSDLDGTTPPPDGSPEFFLNFVNAFNGNSLNLWKFHVDFTTPANSTLSGPSAIPVAAFSTACSGGGSCIPQPGTTNKLASLADRLMYRLAYRNFGDHEALVVNHSVTVSGVTSVRWYEIRSPNGTPGVFQQGTLGTSDGISRWMGSIAMDHLGNIALGYSASSGSVYPSIRYTGRLATDALGVMQTENPIQLGSGSQTGTLQRWGDYSAMSVDPVDDCTFWYTNEYLKGNGTWNWSTRIASFKFTGCGGTPDFSLSASPASQTVTQGSGKSYAVSITPSGGFSGSVTLGVTGLPSGANGTFGPNPATSSSTLTVTTSSSTPTGSYPLTITGTSGSLTHTTSATLLVSQAPAITSANKATFTVGNAGSFTVTTSGSPTPTITETGSLPNGVTFTDNHDGTATLAGTPGAGTGGVYSITITAQNGVSPNATQTFTLTVNQAPAITSSASTTFTVGSAGSFTVTSTGFPVSSLVRGGATLPSGVTFTDNGNGTGTLQGTPGVGTASTYSLTFTANNGLGSDAVQTFTLTVNPAATPDFTLSASPASQTVTQGSSASYTVAVAPSGGFSSSVALDVSGLPAGATGSFSPTSVTGSGTSTLTVTTSATGTPAGTYTLTITGTSGSLSHATNVTLVVTASIVGDFSLTIVPPNQTVARGSGTSYTVTVTPSGGFAGLVNLSLSSLPRATAGSFSPNPTAASSTLTVMTSQSAKKGAYQLTVTGVSGTLTHTVGVTLTIR